MKNSSHAVQLKEKKILINMFKNQLTSRQMFSTPYVVYSNLSYLYNVHDKPFNNIIIERQNKHAINKLSPWRTWSSIEKKYWKAFVIIDRVRAEGYLFFIGQLYLINTKIFRQEFAVLTLIQNRRLRGSNSKIQVIRALFVKNALKTLRSYPQIVNWYLPL